MRRRIRTIGDVGGAGAGVRRVAAWVAEHEMALLPIPALILVVAPSPILPSWLVTCAMVVVAIPFIARFLIFGRASVETPQNMPIAMLLVMLGVGAMVSVDMSLTMLVVKRMVLAVAIFFCLVNGIHQQQQVAQAASALVALGLVMGAVGMLGTTWSTGKVDQLQEVYRRLPHGMFAALNAAGFNANIVGGSLAMIVPVGLGLAASRKGWARLPTLVASAALLAVVVLSQSRGALLGLVVALGVMAVARDRRLLWLALVAAGAVIIAWFQLGGQSLASLVLPGGEGSASIEGRLELWQRAIYMVQDFAFTGIGSGTFSRILPVLYPPFLAPPDTVIPHAHQMYLQAAVDYGLPGFVAFMALLTTLVLAGIGNVRHSTGGERWLATGLLAGFVVYLVHGLTDDVTFSTKPAAVLWVIAGLMAALRRLWSEPEATPAPQGVGGSS